MPGFEPQTDVHIVSVPIDSALEATPIITEQCLLACPDNAGMQMELLSVGYRANTLPIDSTDLHVDIEFIDDSNSDTVTDLTTDFDMAAATVLVYNEVYRGHQILDAGDVINAEFTVTSPSTISAGAALIVEYRILRRSA